jgi:putative protein-disulfide isomerase
MCSWCYGFNTVWQQVLAGLDDSVEVKYLLGGLAPDTNQPMPEEMRANIRDNWRRIEQDIPGTEFNFDFWTECQPRRSTYPSCRAVIAARMQKPESEVKMVEAIRKAYYQQARNPSDLDVLIDIAVSIGLDRQRFIDDISSDECESQLQKEIQQCRDLDVFSFPSLVLKQGKSCTLLDIDYNDKKVILDQIL